MPLMDFKIPNICLSGWSSVLFFLSFSLKRGKMSVGFLGCDCIMHCPFIEPSL